MQPLSKPIEEAITMAIIAGTVMFGAACSGPSTPKPPGPYTACANDDNNPPDDCSTASSGATCDYAETINSQNQTVWTAETCQWKTQGAYGNSCKCAI